MNWAPSLGIAAQTVTLNLSGGAGNTGGITQLDSQSVTQSITTNGTAFGNLTNVEIDANGIVTRGVLQRRHPADRPGGHRHLPQSGRPDRRSAAMRSRSPRTAAPTRLEQPGGGGAGTIDPSTLEASTVDLSSSSRI